MLLTALQLLFLFDALVIYINHHVQTPSVWFLGM
jgi:hypothetical protein